MKFQLAATLLALCGMARATTMHIVTLGKGGELVFCPDQITAEPGDLVQFQFYPKNHSVVQGFFAKGCTPISEAPAATAAPGVFSGFMPVAANATEIPTFTITVNGTTPEWYYCAQAQHCQSGMVFAINPTAAKTLDGYKANCANATQNIVPGEESSVAAPSPAPPAQVPTAPSLPESSPTSTGSSTALPVHTGSMASTISRTGSWAVFGLVGCLTCMMML